METDIVENIELCLMNMQQSFNNLIYTAMLCLVHMLILLFTSRRELYNIKRELYNIKKRIYQKASKAGATTKNENFKQWCIQQNKISPKTSLRQKALELTEYYQNNYAKILEDFPKTRLNKQDPFNTIYNWLKKEFPEQIKNK